MPSDIHGLFEVCKIGNPLGPVKWETLGASSSVTKISDKPGVYVIALPVDPMETAPLSRRMLDGWLRLRGELLVDDNRPSVDQLIDRLSGFWLPDEAILYIGQTTSQTISRRLRQFFNHRLGERRPHAGGQWLKTLSNLDQLNVYWATSTSPERDEGNLIQQFITNVSPETRRQLHDPDHPFPFANLEFPRGTRKAHGMKGMREPRRRKRKG